jgi:type II secretory pathway pseudopilin PulG
MNKGFTIIELIIAIFILSIAIIGVFSTFSVMVILTSSTADRLTAAYLAQEGAEIIKNIRDNNWLSSEAALWDEGLLYCEQSEGCKVDYKSGPNIAGPWTGGEADYLKTGSNGFYSYENDTKTKFRRKVTIVCLPSNDCTTDYIMKVSVQVFWDEKPNILNPAGSQGSIQTENTLYNWY